PWPRVLASWRVFVGLLVFAGVVAALWPWVGASASAHRLRPQRSPIVTRSGSIARGERPNIVLVLTDDLSIDLLRYMPQVQALERRGLTFTNYFVSDS